MRVPHIDGDPKRCRPNIHQCQKRAKGYTGDSTFRKSAASKHSRPARRAADRTAPAKSICGQCGGNSSDIALLFSVVTGGAGGPERLEARCLLATARGPSPALCGGIRWRRDSRLPARHCNHLRFNGPTAPLGAKPGKLGARRSRKEPRQAFHRVQITDAPEVGRVGERVARFLHHETADQGVERLLLECLRQRARCGVSAVRFRTHESAAAAE